jgi:ribonuclease VapC
MVVDTSAIIAILQAEPERDLFIAALFRASSARISPVTWFEASIVAESGGKSALLALDDLLSDAKIAIVPTDFSQTRMAFEAWRRFGKGRHPARLNLGDCFAYALAIGLDEPLLFKGNDFRLTDVSPAL